ncbi:MAG: NAD-dependent epimerase/dehydratase family protein [Erysipelotrichaceae bacterium]|nr:NAD-dependent epimerase/dehydratase family protein [Erysipelotrichaceae bacterium]
MKNVLVIGGTGTISSPITKALSQNEQIRLYVLNRGRRKDDLGETVIRLTADIKNDPERTKEVLKDLSFDCVINFLIMNEEEAKFNAELFRGKTKQFIFISTVLTLDHSVNCVVDETMPYGNKYSAYGRNKEACEKYFLKEWEKGFPVTIVRPTQTYSDSRYPLSVKGKSYWSVCSRMLRGKKVIVHGDGQGVWACTHAKDFKKFFLPLVNKQETIGQIYQIMDPRPYTWDQIYEALAQALGAEYKPCYISEYLLDESRTYDFVSSMHGDKHFSCIFDISKVKQFAPQTVLDVDIKKGAQMFVDYMNAHPEEKKEDEDFDRWCDETIERYEELCRQFVMEL